ncbi:MULTISPECIES: hypothetical protein [Klebsiella pneumoniae complex]|uniref:hypothetical protein n=1 Tax=Klebsiella pneumoniae complex TaxID=3390273 RepID=UPI0013D6B9BB|nr:MULTISPECIES: hypothetical protein [Klebsiella]HBQ3197884.1 hypothetical protein [Klebsiella variicola subsp. variicola]HCQ9126391.1 hypothetical protein [Klebsiella quasipneumoniae subsp. similipneumoniae]MDP0944237.1 hypothetical protein [Klebsiella pneumoniae]MDP1082876.1 hypothetical protein [Klebsiella pneumoniae]WAL50086.1 hypothetical protein OUI59_14600 [Klebsiella variicola subsp. tropica]
MSVEFSALIFVLGRIKTLADRTRDERIAAINGLSPAVGATIAYTTRCEQGHARDLDEEKKLHGLWFDASAKVSPYDKDLAMVCKEKSQYWLQYDSYTQEKVIELGIELEKIATQLEVLKHK